MNDLETLKYIEQAFNKEDTPLLDRVALKQIASYDFGPGFVLGRDSRIVGLSFAGLRNLDMSRIIDDLADLKELRQLNLWQTDLMDIGPLRLLTGLTHLNLGRNQLTDIKPLEALPLEEICLQGSLAEGEVQGKAIEECLTSIDPCGQTDLTKLRITDISVLGKLDKLRNLDLSCNVINGLAAVTRVRELKVGGSWILNFDGFNNFSNLEKLDLSGIKVMVQGQLQRLPNIDFLEALPQLQHLDIGYNFLGDITPLKHLRQLTYLQAQYNQLVHVEPLKKLVRLESLSLESNRIESIDLLFNLTELRHLSLNYNFIKKLSPIEKLTKLESLTIARNPVADWSVLKGFKNLSYLDLSENNIGDLTAIEGLACLSSLQVRRSNISDIGPLATITNLRYLDITSNSVSDLTPLSKLASLKSLRMYRNPVKDISPLLETGLTTLDLDDRNIEEKELLRQLRSSILENSMREFKAREAAELNGHADDKLNDEKVIDPAVIRKDIKEVVSHAQPNSQQLPANNTSSIEHQTPEVLLPSFNKDDLPKIRILKLFLASSYELVNEREKIELALGRKNKSLRKHGFLIELSIWEDNKYIGKSIRSQDNYNIEIKQCDLFAMLFYSKVGKYSLEEFELAYSLFKEKEHPRISVFRKDRDLPKNLSKANADSLFKFLRRLEKLEHFPFLFENIDMLINELEDAIDKLLLDEDFVKGLKVE